MGLLEPRMRTATRAALADAPYSSARSAGPLTRNRMELDAAREENGSLSARRCPGWTPRPARLTPPDPAAGKGFSACRETTCEERKLNRAQPSTAPTGVGPREVFEIVRGRSTDPSAGGKSLGVAALPGTAGYRPALPRVGP